MSDFSPNYRTATELHEQQLDNLRLIKLAFDRSPDSILFINRQGKIFYANHSAHTKLGYSPQSLAQMSLAEIDLNLTGELWPEYYTQLQKEGSLIVDTVWQNRAGEQLQVEVVFNYLEDTDEPFCSLTVRDIEKRKRNEWALKKAKEAAETANRAKSKFLANMSHELRTPLNTILGFTQLIARATTLNGQQQEYLRIINRSSEHLLSLINDVLQIAKIEAGKERLLQTNFDFYALLKSLQDTWQVKAAAKGLEFKMKWKDNIPQYLHADESKLRQILINLLENAIKFTSSGSITLRISRHSQKLTEGKFLLHFEVEDSGFGIAAEEIDRLFEAFVQTKVGFKSQQGTGLGLSISRNFVRLMGGELSVTSTLGKGSCFSFDLVVLPVPAIIETNPHHQQVISLAPGQIEYRILVVEDVKENRLLLTQLLREVGFKVCSAKNGQEAVELWQSWRPHLIWMDIRMPKMDGYQATKKIRQLESQSGQTIIIALTASALANKREKLLKAGCHDFVTKPLRQDIIFDKMAKYLGVRYLYAESKASFDLSFDSSSYDLTPAVFDGLAQDLLIELEQAAAIGDANKVREIIAQLPESHAELAACLTELVNKFRLDKISDSLEIVIK